MVCWGREASSTLTEDMKTSNVTKNGTGRRSIFSFPRLAECPSPAGGRRVRWMALEEPSPALERELSGSVEVKGRLIFPKTEPPMDTGSERLQGSSPSMRSLPNLEIPYLCWASCNLPPSAGPSLTHAKMKRVTVFWLFSLFSLFSFSPARSVFNNLTSQAGKMTSHCHLDLKE